MKRRTPEDQLEFLVCNAARLIIKKYQRRFSQLGLTQSQVTTLVHLDRHGDMNQTDLARKLGLGKAAVGSLLEGLEAEGLIARRRDVLDLRAMVVRINEKGRRRIKGVDVMAEELGIQLRDGLSSEQRRAFIATLVRMIDNLQAMP